jgi:hypothetical protein
MTDHFLITIRESDRRPGVYEARYGGRLLCTSRQPLLDAARVFLAEGADRKARIVMRREGSDLDGLSASIGRAAKLTVEDNQLGKPIFRRFRKRSAEEPDRPPGTLFNNLDAALVTGS